MLYRARFAQWLGEGASVASVRAATREALRDMEQQRIWYLSQGYRMDARDVVPDTMCLVWRNTTLAWEFSCRWTHEVLALSMREQLSFHHAAPVGLRVEWLTLPVRYFFGPAQKVNGR